MVDGKKGGTIVGPSHRQGGIPALNVSTGKVLEVEGGEGIINKTSMADSTQYAVQGTPREIASCVNEVGGGIPLSPTTCKMEVINAPLPIAPGTMAAAGAVITEQGPFELLFWPFTEPVGHIQNMGHIGR